MKSLDEAVVLVTGAGRGVGRALAVEFAQHGASVAAQDISPVNLDETMRQIQDSKSNGLELIGDMSKKMQVQGMIEAAREALGEIDILINQATVAPATDLMTIDEWDWDRTLGVNLKGYFLAIQSVGRIMRDRRQGLIINVVIPPTRYELGKHYPAYAVSAAGIRALTREAARELGPHDVIVCAIEAEENGEASHQSGQEEPGGLTWWQREPERLAAAALDLCLRAEQLRSGELLTIGKDGSLMRADKSIDRTS